VSFIEANFITTKLELRFLYMLVTLFSQLTSNYGIIWGLKSEDLDVTTFLLSRNDASLHDCT